MRDIVKRFGKVVANRGSHLEVAPGEIHALLGENGAGKTTLMRILYSLTKADEGGILWDGQPVTIGSPREAIAMGICMVHQHDMLVPAFTVAENFELSRPERPFGLHLGQTRQRYEQLARRYGITVRATSRVEDLSVGQRQWLSLLRALLGPLRLLILDEPTASLAPQERDELFDTLRQLRADGVSVIFITHKLDEVFALSDRVSVMRLGQTVATLATAETSKQELARLMVGRAFDMRLPRTVREAGAVLLELEGVCVQDCSPPVDEVSMMVREGEIVGIAGVDGNGQRELLECLTGARSPSKGRIRLQGLDLTGGSPAQFISTGVARIPEDRQAHGLALGMSVWENVHLGRLKQLGRRGILDRRTGKRKARDVVGRFDVRVASIEQPARHLSGGNQQKLILGRELADGPQLVIAVNPTRGLDIGATRFVFDRLLDVREQGGGVLFVSYDLDEIMQLCDRVLVMSRGRITGEVSGGKANEEEIGLLMGGESQSA